MFGVFLLISGLVLFASIKTHPDFKKSLDEVEE